MSAPADALLDLSDQPIFRAFGVSAYGWLSPNIEHTGSRMVMRRLCERSPRVPEMADRRLTDLPGVYVWLFSESDAGPCPLRFLHCGQSTVSMRVRVREHIRHAYDGTDGVYELRDGRLDPLCEPKEARCTDAVGQALRTVRVLFLAIIGDTASDAIPRLEAALVHAAVKKLGADEISNTEAKVRGKEDLRLDMWSAYENILKRCDASWLQQAHQATDRTASSN